MGFIVSRYNRFDKNDVRYKFELNGQEYAIMEIENIPFRIEEDEYAYHVYEKFEDAKAFVRYIKNINA